MVKLWKHTAHPESQETKRERTEIRYELFYAGLWQTFIGGKVGINLESVRRSTYTESNRLLVLWLTVGNSACRYLQPEVSSKVED